MSTLRVLGIVQARMGSSRLPGKVLAPIQGVSMLEVILRRVRHSTSVATWVVATTTLESDDPVATVARAAGAAVFRGAEEDVLDRFYQAARQYEADLVVRLTADNPLVDAALVDRCVEEFLAGAPTVAYLDTTSSQTYPLGLSVEVFRLAALEVAWHEDADPASREHVTAFLRSQPERFPARRMGAEVAAADLRWTVDEAEDLDVIRALFERLGLLERNLPWTEIVAYMRAHPELAARNVHVRRKS